MPTGRCHRPVRQPKEFQRYNAPTWTVRGELIGLLRGRHEDPGLSPSTARGQSCRGVTATETLDAISRRGEHGPSPTAPAPAIRSFALAIPPGSPSPQAQGHSYDSSSTDGRGAPIPSACHASSSFSRHSRGSHPDHQEARWGIELFRPVAALRLSDETVGTRPVVLLARSRSTAPASSCRRTGPRGHGRCTARRNRS